MVGMEEWLYQDLESGAFHRSFTPELADKLAALYGIPVEDILDDYTLFLRRGGGDFLRRYRETKGWNRQQLADHAKVSLFLFYLRCILSLPGGFQIFQQRPAHHRACRLGKRQPHFLFQLPDSIGQVGLRNIELLHCMADGAGNSRDIAELLKGHGSFLSACFFYPTAEPPKTQRIFFFEIPNEHCRHIQDTFYPPCNFPYNSTAVLKQLQHSHITKEAFRYGTTAK